MHLGESIKSLREAAGLMQRELAERVGISASMLSFVEAGRREPSISVLRRIGRALEVPTSVLFALALDDTEIDHQTPLGRKAHDLAHSLFDAAMHSVAVRRLQNDHAKKRRVSRRSA